MEPNLEEYPLSRKLEECRVDNSMELVVPDIPDYFDFPFEEIQFRLDDALFYFSINGSTKRDENSNRKALAHRCIIY